MINDASLNGRLLAILLFIFVLTIHLPTYLNGPSPHPREFASKRSKCCRPPPFRGRYSSEGAMEAFICTACGTQYPPSDATPQHCPICEEERQYIPPRGQTWTTLGALAAGHFNSY